MPKHGYPVNYWLSTYLIPAKEGLEPFLNRVEAGDTEGAWRFIRELESDEMDRALMTSLMLQGCGDITGAVKTLEPFCDSNNFYINHTLLKLYISLSNLEGARDVLRRLRAENDEMRAIISNDEGIILWREGRNDEARDRYVRALEMADNCRNIFIKRMCMNNLAIIMQISGDYKGAINLYTRSSALAEDGGDLEGIMTAKLNLGELYKEAGDLNMAKQSLLSAIDVSMTFDSYVSSSARCDCYVNLGDIYLLGKDYSEAKDFYQRALDERFMEDLEAARAHMGMARIAMDENRFEESLELLDMAYEFSKRSRSMRYEAETYLLRGKIRELQGKLQEALQGYGVAIFLFRKLGNVYEVARTEEAVGKLCLKLGDGERSEMHLERARTTFLSISLEDGRSDKN